MDLIIYDRVSLTNNAGGWLTQTESERWERHWWGSVLCHTQEAAANRTRHEQWSSNHGRWLAVRLEMITTGLIHIVTSRCQRDSNLFECNLAPLQIRRWPLTEKAVVLLADHYWISQHWVAFIHDSDIQVCIVSLTETWDCSSNYKASVLSEFGTQIIIGSVLLLMNTHFQIVF